MRVRPWWWKQSWSIGVTLVTATAILCPPPRAAAQPLVGGLGADSYRLAAVPEPPPAPRPPDPADVATDDDAIEPVERAPETILGVPILPAVPVLAGPDERSDGSAADATVRVPPGIPVPMYPMVVNAPVEALIDYFIAKERERFGLWISRSGRYLPMIQRIFRERGLPEELAYTAMIESGFSPRAVSRVGA